jgi:hypothetical protein
MMAAAEVDRYDLVSLGPDATGWRAVIRGSANPSPVIAWGVFHHTIRRKSDGSVVKDLGRIMAGVLAKRHSSIGPVTDFFCAAESPEFEGYLSP